MSTQILLTVMNESGLPSPTENYRVFNGERIPWSLQIKAVGQPGHGSKLYDDSASENLTKSIESMMRFRAFQVHLLKAGLKPEGWVISLSTWFSSKLTDIPCPHVFLFSSFIFTLCDQSWISVTETWGLIGFCYESATIRGRSWFPDIHIPPTVI